MSVAGGPYIVENGLVMCLDAASQLSYPGSGTTWTDVSNSNSNVTLSGSPVYSSSPGSFTFNSSSYGQTISGNISLSSATFIAWVYTTQTQASYTGIINNRSGYNGSTALATSLNFYSNNQVGYNWNDNPSTWGWASGLSVPLSAWCMVAVSVTPTSATAYLCQSSGITTAANSIASSALSNLTFYIAADPYSFGGRTFIGSISIAYIYNRALSPLEIQQNYNAQKSRFGLS